MKIWQTLALALLMITAAPSLHAQERSTAKNIYHNYLLKWKDSINLDSKKEVMKIWAEMPKKVEGVVSLEVIDLSMSTDKYNTMIIVVFKTKEAYTRFTGHPDYVRMANIGLPLLDGLTEFDYLK